MIITKLAYLDTQSTEWRVLVLKSLTWTFTLTLSGSSSNSLGGGVKHTVICIVLWWSLICPPSAAAGDDSDDSDDEPVKAPKPAKTKAPKPPREVSCWFRVCCESMFPCREPFIMLVICLLSNLECLSRQTGGWASMSSVAHPDCLIPVLKVCSQILCWS